MGRVETRHAECAICGAVLHQVIDVERWDAFATNGAERVWRARLSHGCEECGGPLEPVAIAGCVECREHVELLAALDVSSRPARALRLPRGRRHRAR